MSLTAAVPGVRRQGLRVERLSAPLMMNAQAYPYEELLRQPPGTSKPSDIVPREMGSLLVDAAQWGVGGNTAWDSTGQALLHYRTPAGVIRTRFRLTAFVAPTPESDDAPPATASGLAP